MPYMCQSPAGSWSGMSPCVTVTQREAELGAVTQSRVVEVGLLPWGLERAPPTDSSSSGWQETRYVLWKALWIFNCFIGGLQRISGLCHICHQLPSGKMDQWLGPFSLCSAGCRWELHIVLLCRSQEFPVPFGILGSESLLCSGWDLCEEHWSVRHRLHHPGTPTKLGSIVPG